MPTHRKDSDDATPLDQRSTSESDESEEDTPLDKRIQQRKNPSNGESESDESDESVVTIKSLIKKKEIWSVNFKKDLHALLYDEEGYEGCWELSRVKWVEKSVSVTRVPQKATAKVCAGLDLRISFDVKVADDDDAVDGYYYIMYDDFAGAMMVEVINISDRPKGKCFEDTVKFRRVYSAPEAVNRVDKTQSTTRYLGKFDLQKFAQREVDGDPDSVTYHVGDCEYTGDVRKMIGVVRWFTESNRSTHGAKHIREGRAKWQYPEADLVFTGPPFSEKGTTRRRKA
jgi:hypothetical protein